MMTFDLEQLGGKKTCLPAHKQCCISQSCWCAAKPCAFLGVTHSGGRQPSECAAQHRNIRGRSSLGVMSAPTARNQALCSNASFCIGLHAAVVYNAHFVSCHPYVWIPMYGSLCMGCCIPAHMALSGDDAGACTAMHALIVLRLIIHRDIRFVLQVQKNRSLYT